jgi:hypothetical protein
MMRSFLKARRRVGQVGVLSLIVGLASASCGQALLIAPVGSTLAISVNPPFIAAHGDTAIVSVLVLEPAGTPAPDGTVVQFFTTLGVIPEQGKTNDGVVRVTLRSDTNSGTAKVTAFSGASTATSDIVIGATRPARVSTVVLTPRIDLGLGETTAHFKATVFDANGNFVPNVPVRFSVIDNPALDRLLDGPDIHTNNNGDAGARVQTHRDAAGTIRMKAEVLSATALSSEFTIQVVKTVN